MMLVGGRYNLVFQGELTEDKKDIIWKESESLKRDRLGHLAFKMKSNLYTLWSPNKWPHETNYWLFSSCERFDLKENRWFNSPHNFLPPILYPSVVVSADESYAVIVGSRFYIEEREGLSIIHI